MKKEFKEYKQQQEKQKLIDEIIGIEKQRKKKQIKNQKHLMITFKNVSKTRRFQKTHQLISKKL